MNGLSIMKPENWSSPTSIERNIAPNMIAGSHALSSCGIALTRYRVTTGTIRAEAALNVVEGVRDPGRHVSWLKGALSRNSRPGSAVQRPGGNGKGSSRASHIKIGRAPWWDKG